MLENHPYNLTFDSYMLAEEDLSVSRPYRLLEVDQRLGLQISCCNNALYQLRVTSGDVLHS